MLVAVGRGEGLEETTVVAPDRGNLARTAKILPEFVRMYTPLGVLMMKICWPAGILFVLVPAVDCVLVAVPGNMISGKNNEKFQFINKHFN